MKPLTIETGKSFSENMLMLMHFCHRSAIRHLRSKTQIHEHIHEARLCFKRLRSYLRLGREGLGVEVYRSYNGFYRDQARAMSQLRDLTAQIETLNGFAATLRTPASRAFLNHLKAALTSQRRKQLELPEASEVRNEVIHALEMKLDEMLQWTFQAQTAEVFGKGIQRVYGRGRRLYREVTLSPDNDHNMHEWRKQVKYFWYQLLVLNPLWPGMMTAWAKEVQTLSQMLGKHHDLVVLENTLSGLVVDPKYLPVLRQMSKSISRKKQTLTRMSIDLGSKIYFEKPGVTGKKIRALWK